MNEVLFTKAKSPRFEFFYIIHPGEKSKELDKVGGSFCKRKQSQKGTTGETLLFDLKKDMREANNLAPANPDLTGN